MEIKQSFDREAWQLRCKELAEQANRGCGLVYEIFERTFSEGINQELLRFEECQRAEAIEVARTFGWASKEELAQSQRAMVDSGCCSHGLDPDCCPAGCGDLDED